MKQRRNDQPVDVILQKLPALVLIAPDQISDKPGANPPKHFASIQAPPHANHDPKATPDFLTRDLRDELGSAPLDLNHKFIDYIITNARPVGLFHLGFGGAQQWNDRAKRLAIFLELEG